MEFKIQDVIHGGPDYAELGKKGMTSRRLLDFSVSVNPFPLPRNVRRAVKKSSISEYPDPKALELCGAISRFQNRRTDEIIPVNGLSQGIWLLSYLLNSAGRDALIAGPSYGEYEKYSRISGARVIECRSREEDDFIPEAEKLCSRIRESRPRTTWLCNPNNPTGTQLETEDLLKISRACGESEGYLIIDEAYINFLSPENRSSVTAENIIIMRSMTKDFSLPGLRLGYIAADSKIISNLKKLQPVWSVSSQAQAAGIAALKALNVYERQWESLRRTKADFIRMLRDFNLKIFPGTANFIMVKHGNPSEEERNKMRIKLLNSGVLIRDCASFGLPDFARLGVLTSKKNRRLIKVLRKQRLWEK
ncbi:MAG: histidinol-phosphate aminotransferase family protein [Spirochaetales bacterium]|nr:histidinol-phosphate aminotransferase family protein [Spirochaetales bacterium]